MKTVLIIEDDNIMRRLERELCTRLGCGVLDAEDGTEGLRLFKENRIDLVITDWLMPGMSGREVVRVLKTLDPGVKVLIVTGADHVEDPARYGAVGVIEKPFRTQQFMAEVNGYLE